MRNETDADDLILRLVNVISRAINSVGMPPNLTTKDLVMGMAGGLAVVLANQVKPKIARKVAGEIAIELPKLVEHWLSGAVKMRHVTLPGLPGGSTLQ